MQPAMRKSAANTRACGLFDSMDCYLSTVIRLKSVLWVISLGWRKIMLSHLIQCVLQLIWKNLDTSAAAHVHVDVNTRLERCGMDVEVSQAQMTLSSIKKQMGLMADAV